MLINDYIEYHRKLRPTSTLLIEGDTTLSFQQGLNAIYRMANGLKSLGVANNNRVAILGENSIDHILLCFATSLLGAVTVPLNYRLAATELAAIINDAEVTVLIVNDSTMLDKYADMQASLPAGINVYTCAENQADNWQALVAGQPTTPISSNASADDCFLQLYTSGTTGVPKGVLINHNNMIGLAQGCWLMYRAPATAGTIDLVVAPLFHIGGIGSALVPILAGGTTPAAPPV